MVNKALDMHVVILLKPGTTRDQALEIALAVKAALPKELSKVIVADIVEYTKTGGKDDSSVDVQRSVGGPATTSIERSSIAELPNKTEAELQSYQDLDPRRWS